MRFRRTFLASLAPLLSLSALVAAMNAAPRASEYPRSRAESLVRLLRSVAQFAAPAAESVHVSSEHASPQAVLDFAALAATPYRHSLWMVARPDAAPLLSRRHLRAPLRC